MYSWMKGLLAIVMSLSLLSVFQTPALAVYGDGAGDGGQLRNKSGQPMARVKVRLTQKNPDGTERTTETETDRFGIFFVPNTGPAVSKVEFETSDGQVHTFNGPFDKIPEIGGAVLPGTSPEDLILDFNLAKANSVRVAQGSGVSVTGSSYDKSLAHIVQFGLTYGYTFGSTETSVTRNGNKTNGNDVNFGQSSLRPEVRIFLGPLANLGNIANFGNIGNIGNFGNLGPFGLGNCYASFQGAIGLTGGNEGLETDEHPSTPDGQTDTILKQKFNGSFTPSLGCKVADFNQYGYFNFQVGARVSWWKTTFSTDETAGSGNFEQVMKNETKVGPALGLEYNKFLDYGNLDFLSGLGDGVQGGLQVGLWGEYLPGTDISTRTPTFGIDYTASTEGAWVGTARVGIGVTF